MASTALNDINKLTPDNYAIRDLSELLFLEVLKAGAIGELVTTNFGVIHGQHVGGIGKLKMVGKNKPMCNPTFDKTDLGVVQRIWDLGPMMITESLCADDFENTVAQLALNTGTDRADLTQTDLLNLIVEPRLREAIEEAVFRILWFGDKAAKNVVDGGVITDGIDTDFFTMTDGFFKRLFALTAVGAPNESQRVIVGANTSADYAAQRSDIRDAGVATAIFDELIYNANPLLRQASDRMIICTQSFADALAIDLKASNKTSDLHWQSLFNGLVFVTEYNGENIMRVPMFDAMIQANENNGSSWNLPHRAIYTTKSNLWAGFESNETLPALRIWFSEDDQDNKILARDKMGTLIWDDRMFQIAY